jgi:hypothetical protein
MQRGRAARNAAPRIIMRGGRRGARAAAAAPRCTYAIRARGAAAARAIYSIIEDTYLLQLRIIIHLQF